jgi:hypothetical protein
MFYEKFIATRRQMLKAGIRHGLAAARLCQGIHHLDPKLLKQLQGGNGSLRVKLIYITGNEQADGHKEQCLAVDERVCAGGFVISHELMNEPFGLEISIFFGFRGWK